MLEVTGQSGRTCAGMNRRSFLKIGALGLGGLSLPWLLQAKAAAATQKNFLKDKSVIFLCLHGGPSQFETWDPKPEAPAEVRTVLGTVQSKLPGVNFGAMFPKMAAHADELAIVRS